MIRNIAKLFLFFLLTAFSSKLIFLSAASYIPISIFSADGVLSLLYGLRFDATIAALLTAPAALVLLVLNFIRLDMRWAVRLWAALASLWIIGTTASDTIYAEDARKHVTFELFTASGLVDSVLITAFTLYYPLIILGLVFSVASVFIAWRIRWVNMKTSRLTVGKYTLATLSYLVLTVTFIRGGWFDAPQSPMSAYKIGHNDQAYLAWSAPYSVTYYLANGKHKSVSRVTASPDESVQEAFKNALNHETRPNISNLKKANVVFILLESWVSIDMNSENPAHHSTPFFEELRARSLTADAMYADGYRTVQGVFASMCSFPNPNGGIVAGTHLQNSKYKCLPHMLREQGWDTRFIQGSGKGIVGAYSQSLGFTESYGKEDFDFEAPHNEWGFQDDSIYRFSMDRIKEIQNSDSDSPFFVTINTGTTHGSILPNESDYTFGKESMPELRRSTMHYADLALKDFIKELHETVKEPTLVVMMSDHTAKIVEPGLAKNSIPFLIYANDGSVPALHHKTAVSQRDVGATILDWLGGSVPWFTGSSLLDENFNGQSSFSDGSLFFWVDGKNMITIESSNHELQQCFHIQKDTVTLQKADCSEPWVEPLYQQGRDFNALTQELLFNGETTQYRDIFSQKN
ncbi:putative Sulfatase/Phosphoglycerol transferase/alkaline phosphatase superfamily [Vibrio nigripulchritudo SFn27]|uniref:Putative Sulfatase/Phosphoglycerol transferase/alkaline phosphatase superfamily n=1 Tax=Vibrio nigripulchritudo TaxID=28173 RepID=U4KHM0_9VIBR|nr:LTA synthase family protein [Vibrio nigripulchritudo]CCN80383.1 putative Sulfatase/Phosphoglycerol transferase/alkaline phosphatase superfamily [Vibrio nigripulchritudo BLFn1]CCN91307.1 putative Sulfatase/Phosphoglycerol transferase/alkaline phosphatase superfamily [Vibrio nigripulchritudo SFn27]CCN92608.1 putative Sulfatase/Phosphoglycerol transferase/alkaline phosphatase superfamily [Vibrio nigripulchritudo ENn2]CCO41012.1 putative Sulfatase/Phosphoglycerol transferase/alkaline phosphatase